MNDLDLITDVAPEAPLPGPGELAAARGRLCAAITAERVGEPAPTMRPGPAQRPGPTRRSRAVRWRGSGVWPSRGLAVTAAAAAVVAATATTLVVVPGHGSSEPSATRPHPASSAPGARAGSGQAPVAVDLAAARFLRQAAVTVGQQPASAPGADQFVYTETEQANGPKSRQWLSAEGNKAGLVQNAGQSSFRSPPCTVAQAQVTHCYEQAGYLPSMPADAHRLFAYLVKVGIADAPPSPGSPQAATPGWLTNDLGKVVDYLMETTYLPPAQRAALFKLMAQTPGFTVVSGARDAIGRTGMAVRWAYEGAPAEIIFNPASYAYMGDRTWPVPSVHGPGADAYHGAALVRMAFVNQAAQLP